MVCISPVISVASGDLVVTLVSFPQQTTTLFFCASFGFSGRAIFISIDWICVVEAEFRRAV